MLKKENTDSHTSLLLEKELDEDEKSVLLYFRTVMFPVCVALSFCVFMILNVGISQMISFNHSKVNDSREGKFTYNNLLQ